jgi:methionyl-tRNA formyltransferase
MRIVFIGSVLFSENALLKLLNLNANIVGIITKEKSSYNSDFIDLSFISKERDIPFKYVNDINHPNNVKWIDQLKPDILFCFGWSSLIKAEILSLTKLGVVGFHPALLPNNKGRHPLIWAKVLGLSKTGSTYFFMDEGADTGDILEQQYFEISDDDDINDIYNNMTRVALNQIEIFYPKLINGNYDRIKQIDIGNTWRKRNRLDGLIDFRMSTTSIVNLIRALTKPFPGAHCEINGKEYKIWKCEPGSFTLNYLEPGKVLEISENIIEIKTADGSIRLTEHELPILTKGEYIIK